MTAAAPAYTLVDFGSTFTKVRVVGADGTLVGVAQHRTTIESDVLEGLEAALGALAGDGIDGRAGRTVACSSAGGGLRMGVVGLIDELTAEAARQTALGAGARTVAVMSGGLADADAARALLAQEPDIVLISGGTDGGDRRSLLASARALAAARVEVPVVLAGNAEARPEAAELLRAAGAHVVEAANVMPEVGRLDPDAARDEIRNLFISHVIGGKLRGSTETLESLVQMATPDAVLRGVEVLASVLTARGSGGGVVAVDVGGATTDVHSWVPVRVRSGYKRSLRPVAQSARTVEADLGMRWNAPGIVEAAAREGLIDRARAAELEPVAELRASEPGFLPERPEEHADELEFARLAVALALRRHAGTRRVSLTPDGAVVQQDGRDLTSVSRLVLLGGVMRLLRPEDVAASLELAKDGRADRLLPDALEVGFDLRGAIAAAGLLAEVDEGLARQVLEGELAAIFPAGEGKVEKEVSNVEIAS